MKKVPVLDGSEVLWALLDDDDAERASVWTWRAHRAARSRTVYARGYVDGRRVLLHRFILADDAGAVTDHIDGNGLNNQRSNLRAVTQQQNCIARFAREAFDRYAEQL